MARRGLLVWFTIWLSTALPAALGQPPPLGYEAYTRWEDWARLKVGVRAGLASSFDRSGGNADYNQYESPPGLQTGALPTVAATIQGPGVLNRFWMPHASANQAFPLRLFFDGETTPRIDTTSQQWLGGGYGYFQAPLVDTFAGGQVSYDPIPFAQSLRIETANRGTALDRHYYQWTYLTYPPTTSIATYSGTLTPVQQADRATVVDMFSHTGRHPAGESPTAVCLTTSASSIGAGQTLHLADIAGPGLVRRISLRMGTADDTTLSAVRLRVTYDGMTDPAIDVPLDAFFGAGHGRAAYHSLPLGTDSPEGFYCYWPMPFHQSVSIVLVNGGATATVDAAVVEYEPCPVDPYQCYLHACFATSTAPADGYHTLLTRAGRGHYVGNLLYVYSTIGNFYMLEGDEVITVDGAAVLHGTGTEDAYNGGYYYNWAASQSGEPEGIAPASAIRPLSGILSVNWATNDSRADQYRWQIADAVPFSSSIQVRMESIYAYPGSVHTSVAFWYEWPAPAIAPDGDVNLDGGTDGADIAAFLAWLVGDGVDDPVRIAHGDYNASGMIDAGDVSGFVNDLLN